MELSGSATSDHLLHGRQRKNGQHGADADDAEGVLHSTSSALQLLSQISTGRHSAVRARRLFMRNVQISVLVASWTVFLTLPIIVWPFSDWLWFRFNSCHKFDDDFFACWKEKGCKPSWARLHFICKGEIYGMLRGVQGLWGTMVLQFLFSVYIDFGNTVQLSVQGLMGTSIASLNMVFLNHVLSRFVGGGAHAHSFQVTSGSNTYINSQWLPLCNDGFNVLTDTEDQVWGNCWFNIWWSKLTWAGSCKFLLVSTDFVVVVVLCLLLGFDRNTRMFALSTHIYFMMSFVNPTSTDYATFPTVAENYLLMIAIASVLAIMCFLFPRRRFTAAGVADRLTEQAVHAVSLLLESLCGATKVLMRQKVASALSESEVLLDELDANIDASWFEDFGQGLRAQRRRRQRSFATCLRSCAGQVPRVLYVARSLSPADCQTIETDFSSLQNACVYVRDLLLKAHAADRGRVLASFDPSFAADLASEFATKRSELSPEACAFLFTISASVSEAVEAVHRFAEEEERSSPRRCGWDTLPRFARVVRKRFGLQLIERSVTHPRFVVRNTISICLAFCIGWLGLWNVLPAYSSYAASTVAVILYAFPDTSANITIRRVAGVVMGKVMGTALQLGFAVRAFWKAVVYGSSLWIVVCVLFFGYLHGDDNIGYVCCLAAAFAASSMIPSECNFRSWGSTNFADVTPDLLNTIVSTVIGVFIMVVVDAFLASKATDHARRRLLRCIKRVRKFFIAAAPAHQITGGDAAAVAAGQDEKLFFEDLDALRRVIPFAADELEILGRVPFKKELYQALERHLRELGSYLQALSWAAYATPTTAESVQRDAPDGEERHPAAQANEPMIASCFQPLFARLHEEMMPKLHAIEKLAVSVTLPREDKESVEEVRNQLVETLYTGMAARYIAMGTASAFDRVKHGLLERDFLRASQERTCVETGAAPSAADAVDAEAPASCADPSVAGPNASVASVASSGATSRRALGPVQRFWRQAFDEELDEVYDMRRDSSQEEISQIADRHAGQPIVPLSSLFAQLREQAACQTARPPHADGLCRAELVILLVQSCLLEAQQIELALLEYT